ncbi:MAG: DNA polymerase IV [Candidatus Hydrogenedens sp.]|jgi:DNA polymerase-4|nr:DNA polymerase IV [Candidatus Hydrogenedens sp.]
MRRILHIDMDAFFASVEVARNPALRGKAVIIGGNPEDRRGVVSSASYEARSFGVRSAMPIVRARQLCPHGIFIRGSHSVYGEVSRRIREILHSVTPLVQMASIDEAHLDITGSVHLFENEAALAAFLKRKIVEQEQITATIGIASNKMVAKIAANQCKPDGFLAIAPGQEEEFLAALSVSELPGVGPRSREILEMRGIMTVRQLAQIPESHLAQLMGVQAAAGLLAAARGIASDVVEPVRVPKSVSKETTFSEDLADWDELASVLFCLVEHCTHTLRSEGLEARKVSLKVRYSDFETKLFGLTLPEPTCLDTQVVDALKVLLPKAQQRRTRVRLIGVSLSGLSKDQHQMGLFDQKEREKWERLLHTVDDVRDKMGFDSMRLGNTLKVRKKEDSAQD